ncbi:MAG: hypothetical protein JXR94_08990, partial [Candidatus Hydrogenedentes bacterium]|nr:hypothetical protein [Candidatus Hydrogenedentota bacterium]
RRHFIHGDLVGLGIFAMTRLQDNRHGWAVNLMDRLGLRYACPDVTPDELRACLTTLKSFKDKARLFYSVVDWAELPPEFADDIARSLYP